MTIASLHQTSVAAIVKAAAATGYYLAHVAPTSVRYTCDLLRDQIFHIAMTSNLTCTATIRASIVSILCIVCTYSCEHQLAQAGCDFPVKQARVICPAMILTAHRSKCTDAAFHIPQTGHRFSFTVLALLSSFAIQADLKLILELRILGHYWSFNYHCQQAVM